MARMVLNETSYFGAGCRKEVVNELAKRNMKKAFIISDKDLVKFNVVKMVTDVLEGAGVAYTIFDDVKANPTINNVKNALAAFKAFNPDVIIAIGGGSCIDTSKAVGIIINNPEFGDVKSLEGVANTKKKAFPTICFATTSGTAAEVTINYVITDEEAGRKLVCVDPNDIPMIAFNDAEMMMSMPKGLTASTGMDALTHAIEGYITPGANAISDLLCWNSIKFIADNLRDAVKDGSNAAAREGMAYGSYVAGMAFSNVNYPETGILVAYADKYSHWCCGGNGGILRQPTGRLYDYQKKAIRAGLKAIGIEPREPEEEFFIGRMNYAKGYRMKRY